MSIQQLPSLRLGAAVAAALTVQPLTAADSSRLDVPVIDMHTHVFNARDIPIEGILGSFNVGWPFNAILADIIRAFTPSDDDSPGLSGAGLRAAVRNPQIKLTDDQRRQLERFVGDTADRIAKAYRAEQGELRSRGETDLLDLSSPEAADALLLAEALRLANFPPGESDVVDASQQRLNPARSLASIRGYLRFIGIMTSNHRDIANYLRHEAYPNADLFIHHMMDMEKAYDSAPANPFHHQIVQVQQIDREHNGAFGHFVAFDPFRRSDALSLVQDGHREGALGIKFYPPSGYRASQNFFDRRPSNRGDRERWDSRYANWTPQQLDTTIREVFAWAEGVGAPIFTHCTPYGFQAVKGYGMRGDPFYWEELIKAYPKLRFCFGHAGGEVYWFSDPGKDTSHTDKPPVDTQPPLARPDLWLFGKQVVDLALKYPNVYFEVGYLEGVLTKKGQDQLVARLSADLGKKSADQTYTLGDRIMYGSDWHQLHKEENFNQYISRWDEVIKRVGNGVWRKKFFSGNAVKFLDLQAQAQRPVFVAQKAHWEKIVRDSAP